MGCSIGKYLTVSGIKIAGYYDISKEAADSAAAFTDSQSFMNTEDLIRQSSILFLTTPDSIIQSTWNEIRSLPITGKIICHCSGALPSDAFTGIEETGASGCSFHPMLPFSSRFSSYEQLSHSFFTIEGHDTAIKTVSDLFTGLGNTVCRIPGECKPKYHAAASILSNQVIAALDTGYHLLEECGFSRKDAIKATRELVLQNIENVLQHDCAQALTGPIERNDIQTVQKHLDCLDKTDCDMYRILGLKLLQIAKKKNPLQDYTQLQNKLET